MKNSYITLNPQLSIKDNLKEIVNKEFRKEISLDILRNEPPNYDNLRVNGISIQFIDKYKAHESDSFESIKYIQMSFYSESSRRSCHIRKSIKVDDKQRINIMYLRKCFDKLNEIAESIRNLKLERERKQQETIEILSKIKSRNGIITDSKISLHKYDTTFQLYFNSITEDDVDYLMSHWNRIKK